MRVVLNTLRTVFLTVRAQLSVDLSTFLVTAARFELVCPTSGWTHARSLTDHPWRVLAGRHLFRCLMEGGRQVSASPMRQLEQIFRSTALLNPALALTHPHIVVLLSATRVCLAGQARPKPSTRSRSGGWRGLARFAPARIPRGGCTPTACIAHLFSCSPCLGSAWGQCCMLVLLLHAHLPLLTVHLWRVVLWLEYFWRVRYAAISLLVPVGELPPLQSTSVRV